nr:hypothetical protein [Anaerolineae bacterium]
MTEDRLKAGVEALRTGDRRKARRLLGQVVNEDPDNPTAWWYLAAVLETTEQKIHSLQQVLRLHPDHEQARQLLERLEKRQVKTRPAHTLPPVVDAAPDQHGELAIPKPDELGDMEPAQHVSDSVVAVIAVSIALLAILLTALLAWSGIGAGFLGIQQGPDPEPTRPPLVFDTPACSLISSELARIVFINNSGVDVEILVGET